MARRHGAEQRTVQKALHDLRDRQERQHRGKDASRPERERGGERKREKDVCQNVRRARFPRYACAERVFIEPVPDVPPPDAAGAFGKTQRLLRDAHLAHVPPPGKRFDPRAVIPAAALVHIRVYARRVAPEDTLDRVGVFQHRSEIERGNVPQRREPYGGSRGGRRIAAVELREPEERRRAQRCADQTKLAPGERRLPLKPLKKHAEPFLVHAPAAGREQHPAKRRDERPLARRTEPPRSVKLRPGGIRFPLAQPEIVEQPPRPALRRGAGRLQPPRRGTQRTQRIPEHILRHRARHNARHGHRPRRAFGVMRQLADGNDDRLHTFFLQHIIHDIHGTFFPAAGRVIPPAGKAHGAAFFFFLSAKNP